VQDLSSKQYKDHKVLLKHESFQLWESTVSSLLLNVRKDLLSFSKAGINVIALGSVEKRVLVNNQGHDMMLHSLDSMNFLKIDRLNHINFNCQD
jgi:hypothetical protein